MGNEDDKTEMEKMKMKAVEVELNQEKSITEEMKRKVEAEKMENQRKRGRKEDDGDNNEEEVEKKERVDEEDPFDKIRATASENKLKSPQLSVSVPNGLKVKINSNMFLLLSQNIFRQNP